MLLLLSLAAFSVISVASYLLLALLCVTITFRIYKSVIQAVQKSSDGHPFKYVRALISSMFLHRDDLYEVRGQRTSPTKCFREFETTRTLPGAGCLTRLRNRQKWVLARDATKTPTVSGWVPACRWDGFRRSPRLCSTLLSWALLHKTPSILKDT